MVDRYFVETLDTKYEGGTVVSKVGGRYCVSNGGVTLGGRGGKKSKGGVQRRVGINNVVQRSFGLMVAGVNTSWEMISGSEMKAGIRAGLCHWRKEFVRSIL